MRARILLTGIYFAAMAPVSPFLSTIMKQRGYSLVVVGTVLTVVPLPGLLVRPVVGVFTDKYKCRKLAIILNACVMFMLVCGILFAPGASAAESKLADSEVIRSPAFWFFAVVVVLLKTAYAVNTVLGDTICVDLLGKRLVLVCLFEKKKCIYILMNLTSTTRPRVNA